MNCMQEIFQERYNPLSNQEEEAESIPQTICLIAISKMKNIRLKKSKNRLQELVGRYDSE